jgi:hypothetical protein
MRHGAESAHSSWRRRSRNEGSTEKSEMVQWLKNNARHPCEMGCVGHHFAVDHGSSSLVRLGSCSAGHPRHHSHLHPSLLTTLSRRLDFEAAVRCIFYVCIAPHYASSLIVVLRTTPSQPRWPLRTFAPYILTTASKYGHKHTALLVGVLSPLSHYYCALHTT